MEVLDAVAMATESASVAVTGVAEAEELAGLIAAGHERGYLTVESVANAVEELDVSKEQVRELYAQLEEHGIELVSEVAISPALDEAVGAHERRVAGTGAVGEDAFALSLDRGRRAVGELLTLDEIGREPVAGE